MTWRHACTARSPNWPSADMSRPSPPAPPGGAQPGAGPTARAYLDALGMAAGEVDCAELQGRVVRLTHPDMSPQELSDVARELRARGFTASVTNITPTAPIGKGIGGPPPGPPPPPPARPP